MRRIEFYFLILIIFIFSCKKDDSDMTIHVPGDISSIQEAINRANDFDTILVSRGQYNESLTFNGKRIYLTSFYYRTQDTLDIVNTVIKGKGRSVVRFQNQEDTTAVLDGFTLTGGAGEKAISAVDIGNNGGGIYIKETNPTLKNLIIEYNYVFEPNEKGAGGGIYCESGSIKATNVKIRNNTAGASRGGGGIYAENSIVILDKCEIINNETRMMGGRDGLHFLDINVIIENSKIDGHSMFYKSVGSFVNTIINEYINLGNNNIEFNNCIINGVIYP